LLAGAIEDQAGSYPNGLRAGQDLLVGEVLGELESHSGLLWPV
jgi:hypothetical protein